MRIDLFADSDNSGRIDFLNDRERIDFTDGPDDDSTVLEKSLGAGTYVVRVVNRTGFLTSSESSADAVTSLDLNIRVERAGSQ